jgi:manganese oxidase
MCTGSFRSRISNGLIALLGLPLLAFAQDQSCEARNTVVADVVAIDMPMVFNRLGAQNVNWQMYALRHDLVLRSPDRPPRPLTSDELASPRALVGKVTLRPDLRPRPLVLRLAAGECLQVNFTNLLTGISNPFEAHKPEPDLLPAGHPMDQRSRDPNMDIDDQVASRMAGFHPSGLELVGSIASDASHAGNNPSALAAPGQTRRYTFRATAEGSFLVTNPGAAFGGEGTAGTSGTGLFGVVAVQPPRGRAYRGQVTEEELRLATRRLNDPALAGQAVQACVHDAALACTPGGQPLIDYEAVYPAAAPWLAEGKAGLPVLNMFATERSGARRLVHGDINAIVLGPEKDGSFPKSTYPLESTGVRNPTLPNRLEPFREFVSVFHDENAAAQAFPGLFEHPVLGHTLHGVRDAFMINYGSAGVGAEVIANRLGVGPMHDCVDCAFEEFFLSSFTVGDPALLVDRPANIGLEQVAPVNNLPAPDLVGVPEELVKELHAKDAGRPIGDKLFGPKASKVYYPHDPANVHHSYLGDFVKFRNLHTGKEQHIFHLHNHQWLFNPNDDNSNYIDAQAIGPGSGYTYEIAFGGSGNRNKSAGDAVFHCHYYPHFAQGMWYLWRIHDTFEQGTRLQVSEARGGLRERPFALADGTPAKGARALPDGEIAAGTPIPAVVPLPGKALAPMPGEVAVVPNPRQLPDGRPVGSLAKVIDRDRNPGFPFWIAGIEDTVGSRPPTPPLDMDPGVGGFDGGLPRHTVEGLSAGSEAHGKFTRLNAEKHESKVKPRYFPERGTDMEQVAMKFHAQVAHSSHAVLPGGGVQPALFETNGARPAPGAPFFDPCIDDRRRRLTAGERPEFFGAQGLAYMGSSPFNADTPRVYKGANVQLDVTLNKLGDHYPQQRILTLWEDVDATLLTSFKPRTDSTEKPRAPEPMVLRMNTFDCARYLHTNLVPKEFEMDDYQVKTPTDIIGQHIHLPKWDLPSADGSANGWNYEDGTFSPGMVRSRIKAINTWNDSAGGAAVPNPYAPGQIAFDPTLPAVAANAKLKPRAHYFFGRKGPFQFDNCEKLWEERGYEAFHNRTEEGLALPGTCDWLGARTTIQRWFSDPIINKEHQHRGLGITFTHDHLGPSTHQQVGLYATMLTEPPASTWVHNESGELLYDRDAVACNDLDPDTWNGRRCDGGPTSWQAVILPKDPKEHEPHREFFLQFGDFQHAYRKGEYRGVNEIGMVKPADAQSFRKAITPSFRQPAKPQFPDVIALDAHCPGQSEPFMLKRMQGGNVVDYNAGNTPANIPRPCPEIISADDVGTMVVNYRQEPIAARVFDPNLKHQAANRAGDLAFAFQTRTDRKLGPLNTVQGDTPYDPLTHDVRAGDPFTPILRAYSGDLVRIKIQAGSHEHEHSTALNALKWLQAGSGYGQAPHSGWRGGQNIGLSEQFTMSMRITDHGEDGRVNATDRLYAVDTSQDGLWNGVWGFVRTLQRRDPGADKDKMFRDDQDRLVLLPNLANPADPPRPVVLAPQDKGMRRNDCPAGAPVRQYQLVAGLANRLLPPAANVSLPRSRGLNQDGGTLVYNPRQTEITLNVFHEADDPLTPQIEQPGTLKETRRFGFGPLHDPTAILVVRKSDIDPASKQLKPRAPVEPIVLRAAAGDCVQVVLENWLPQVHQGPMPELPGFTTLGMLVARDEGSGTSKFTSFNNNHVRASRHIGLHPQMLQYDPQWFDGNVVGVNHASVVPPGGTILYKWYAGGLQYGDGPASANVCEVSDGPVGGFDLINQLRDQLRQTPEGLRRLRPPNHLLTPEVLLTRLQLLLAPAPVDQPLPASIDERRVGGGLDVIPRPLRLDSAALAALRRIQPRSDLAALAAVVSPPEGVRSTDFDALLTKAWNALLDQPAVAACMEQPVRGEPQSTPLPDEALLVLRGGDPRLLRAAGTDMAPVYPPEAAFSSVEALNRRLACADAMRAPVAEVLRQVYDNTFLKPEQQQQVARDLASSVAFMVPGLDPDAFGGADFESAFRWYQARAEAPLLTRETTRLVTTSAMCRFVGIEFGGTNLTPPDRIKQGQKAAVGALVVEPEKSFWWETVDDTALDRQNPGPAPGAVRASRATASVLYPASLSGAQPKDWRFFRDLVAVHQKGLNMRYGKYPANGHHGAVGSLAAERESALEPPSDRIAPEDAHDAGQMAINYGSEPMWFRFGLEPSAPFGHGPSVSNPASRGEGMGALRFAHQGFSNQCCQSNATQPSSSASQPVGDPYTPIFKVPPQAEVRLRNLLPTGAGRGTTSILHGHSWLRDPYLAENTQPLGAFGGQPMPAGLPVQYGTPSKCIGRNALGMALGAQDSFAPLAHFDWVLPSAGGGGGIPGDYLMRDIGGFGVTSGLWALMRVEGNPLPASLRKGLRTACL